MADLITTTDIVNYILQGMNELTDGTSPFESAVLDQINHANRTIYAGGGELNAGEKRKPLVPSWAKSQYPLIVNLEPYIFAGTVNVANNSSAITFSVPPASSVAGWMIKIDGEPEVYRIAAHTGGAGPATLDSIYVGANNTAATYKAFKTRYSLGNDILGLISPLRVFSDTQRGVDGRRQIDVIAEDAFDARYPVSLIRNEFPSHAKIVYSQPGAGTNSIDIVINAYVTDRERIEVPYVRIPAVLNKTGSDPVMPVQWRTLLAEYGLFFMYRDTDDDRAGTQIGIVKSKFEAIANEAAGESMTANYEYGRIYPRGEDSGALDALVRTEDGFILTQ